MKTEKALNINYLRENFEYRSDGELIIKKTTPRGRPLGSVVIGWTKRSKHLKYRCMAVQGVKVRLHRVIFAIVHGYLPENIDHADGDTLNNRIENLRPCSKSENMFNEKIRSDNSTGIKGLGFIHTSSRWRGRIKVNGKVYFLQSKDRQKVIDWISKTRTALHKDFARSY